MLFCCRETGFVPCSAAAGLAVGAAYVYSLVGSSWTLEDTGTLEGTTGNGRFGYSVSAGDNVIFVGAPNVPVTLVSGKWMDSWLD